MDSRDDRMLALLKLRDELQRGGRTDELAALDAVIAGMAPPAGQPEGVPAAADGPGSRARKSGKTYLKLRKKFYTPAEVAKKVGVSRQTVVKWIERGELDAETTPGGHHRIPASVFHREGRGESVQLIPAEDD